MSQFNPTDSENEPGSAILHGRNSWEQENKSSVEIKTSYKENRIRKRNGLGAGYLIRLTVGTGGLQIVWTSIMGQGSPYLSSLGLPPWIISFIWLAGPISGTVVQPYISILSDRSRHPWGRRKPYIGVGTILTTACMLLLPRTGEMVSWILGCSEAVDESTLALVVRGVVASALIWGLNISIQPVQMGLRALIVDACPSDQQIRATSYASCIIGIGTVVGYGLGFVELPQLFPWLGDTQFKCLSIIASLALSSTVVVTLWTIGEREILLDDVPNNRVVGIMGVFREVLRNARLMSKRVKMVCKAQFFAWMGWFPFLFYITTYLGDLYENKRSAENWSTSNSYLHEDAVRKGALAMMLFAAIALLSNFILPLFVSPSSSALKRSTAYELSKLSNSQDEENEGLLSTERDSKSSPKPSRFSILKFSLPLQSLTLPRAWAASQILASANLFSTSFSKSPALSTVFVSLLGISWALTQWAPLALISSSIASQQPVQATDLEAHDSTDEDEKEDDFPLTTGESQVGAVMGVYNAAIAAPQIIAAVWSGGLFWILGKWGINNAEAVRWVIRFASLTGIVSAWFALEVDRL